jgi:hypothetical protein
MKVIIHPGASADIQEGAEYYEGKQAGFGLAFLDEVDTAIDTIVSMPQAFPERRKVIRMFVFSRFPFSLALRSGNRAADVSQSH